MNRSIKAIDLIKGDHYNAGPDVTGRPITQIVLGYL